VCLSHHMPCVFWHAGFMRLHAALASQAAANFAGDDPYVLCGDWNVTPTSSAYALLTWCRGRASALWRWDVAPCRRALRSGLAVAAGAQPHHNAHARARGTLLLANPSALPRLHLRITGVARRERRASSRGPAPDAQRHEPCDHALMLRPWRCCPEDRRPGALVVAKGTLARFKRRRRPELVIPLHWQALPVHWHSKKLWGPNADAFDSKRMATTRPGHKRSRAEERDAILASKRDAEDDRIEALVFGADVAKRDVQSRAAAIRASTSRALARDIAAPPAAAAWHDDDDDAVGVNLAAVSRTWQAERDRGRSRRPWP